MKSIVLQSSCDWHATGELVKMDMQKLARNKHHPHTNQLAKFVCATDHRYTPETVVVGEHQTRTIAGCGYKSRRTKNILIKLFCDKGVDFRRVRQRETFHVGCGSSTCTFHLQHSTIVARSKAATFGFLCAMCVCVCVSFFYCKYVSFD